MIVFVNLFSLACFLFSFICFFFSPILLLRSLSCSYLRLLKPEDWSGLESGSVVLEVDEGQDGSVDETQMLTNQAPDHKAFLPVVLRRNEAPRVWWMGELLNNE